MAMMDYGAVVKINGKIVNENEFFMDMQKAVGWVDYPKVRYEDCDCLDEDGYSDCSECPRRKMKHMSNPELGEWDATVGDCRGNKLWIDNKLDRNYFAYVGDEDFTVAVYKTHAVLTNKNASVCMYAWDVILGSREVSWEPDLNRLSRTFTVQVNDEPIHIKVRKVGESNVLYMRFWYKKNLYELVYGYGIDSNQKTWNEVKSRYANKKTIRFVDNFWKTRK